MYNIDLDRYRYM